ncbi:hypothetical protein DPMN_088847 [Dreissena polymorpha]|uniref:Uncharacterized protein n=1 Tax=Dreissena polymorpha TaxID=45954 RepID=A0A9D4KUU6_DREPO|nr:hypothetical protein DPMN_088847 [Dreissena polymorpha]
MDRQSQDHRHMETGEPRSHRTTDRKPEMEVDWPRLAKTSRRHQPVGLTVEKDKAKDESDALMEAIM